MFDTQITVVGNLVADPRMSRTKEGHAVASFRVASTPRRFDRAAGEWRDGDTLFANVTCWRGLAENVQSSLRKGHAVVVIGRLSVRPYETREGEKRQSVDIDALAVGPDLARAVAEVRRPTRPAPAAPFDDSQVEAAPGLDAGPADFDASNDMAVVSAGLASSAA